MLAKNANGVLNVRGAQGRAVLRRGGREDVRLLEVEPPKRAPSPRRYLAVAPGARPHIPVNRHASPEEFQRIAEEYPVFRIVPARTNVGPSPGSEVKEAR